MACLIIVYCWNECMNGLSNVGMLRHPGNVVIIQEHWSLIDVLDMYDYSGWAYQICSSLCSLKSNQSTFSVFNIILNFTLTWTWNKYLDSLSLSNGPHTVTCPDVCSTANMTSSPSGSPEQYSDPCNLLVHGAWWKSLTLRWCNAVVYWCRIVSRVWGIHSKDKSRCIFLCEPD